MTFTKKNYLKNSTTERVLTHISNQLNKPNNLTQISRATLVSYHACFMITKTLTEDGLITTKKIGRQNNYIITKLGEKAVNLLKELKQMEGKTL